MTKIDPQVLTIAPGIRTRARRESLNEPDRSPLRRYVAVFEVCDCAVVVPVHCGRNAAHEPVGHQAAEIVKRVVTVGREFGVVECDLVGGRIVEAAACEDEEDLVSVGVGRCPVGDQQSADRWDNAEFLAYLADAGLSRRFTGLNT
jgi:hypothetical protein